MAKVVKPQRLVLRVGMPVRFKRTAFVPILLQGCYGTLIHMDRHTVPGTDGRFRISLALWPEETYLQAPNFWFEPLPPELGARIAYAENQIRGSRTRPLTTELADLRHAYDVLGIVWTGLMDLVRVEGLQLPYSPLTVTAKGSREFLQRCGTLPAACDQTLLADCDRAWNALTEAALNCRLQAEGVLEA